MNKVTGNEKRQTIETMLVGEFGIITNGPDCIDKHVFRTNSHYAIILETGETLETGLSSYSVRILDSLTMER